MRRQTLRSSLTVLSLLLFPVTLSFFSPAIPFMAAMEGLIAGSIVLFIGLFVTSLFFGRAFCGWICPGGAGQDLFTQINSRPISRGNWIKVAIWAVWLAALVGVVVFVAPKPLVCAPLFQTMFEPNGGSLAPLLITYYAIIGLILGLSVVVGRRSFCHHMCWMAPFMMSGAWMKEKLGYQSLRLIANKPLCTSCGRCDCVCPMSLSPQELVAKDTMFDSECILCAQCADECPRNVIACTFAPRS